MIDFYYGRKKPEYYKNLLIKADLNLHDQIAVKIHKEIHHGGKVLDLGAGEGALSERLSDLGFHVTAADKDEENFKCKNAVFSRINFDNSEEISKFVEKYEGQFDAVLGVEVIEHVQDQWQYVRQLMKMAKPGGLVLITTPNTTSWYSRWVFFITGRFHQFADADLSYGHINPISAWELHLILKATNAVDVKIVPAGTLPAIYLGGLNRVTLLSLITFPLRPLMKGFVDGWCIMATARKVK
jgi:2-polyprenyl-3-methyl-5-hydroxy-6-metoxy-1,4-benzoquinol methylase